MPRETLSLEDRKQLLAMKHFDYGHVVIKVLQVLDAAEHELITQAEKQLEKRVAELREDRDHYKERALHAESRMEEIITALNSHLDEKGQFRK